MPNKEITNMLQEISNKKENLRNNILSLIKEFEKETTIRIEKAVMCTSVNVKDVHIKLDFGM